VVFIFCKGDDVIWLSKDTNMKKTKEDQKERQTYM